MNTPRRPPSSASRPGAHRVLGGGLLLALAASGPGCTSSSTAGTGVGGASASSSTGLSVGTSGASSSGGGGGGGGASTTSASSSTTGAGGASASSASASTTSASSSTTGAGGASASSSSASSSSASSSSASSSSSGAGGAANGLCATTGLNGGDTVWTTTRPAPGPISGFPGNPKGWRLDNIFAGSTAHAFVATSFYVPQPGQAGVSPGGVELDELDSDGAYLGTRSMTDSGGGFASKAVVFGANHYAFTAYIPHAMGVHYNRLQSDAVALSWQWSNSALTGASIGAVAGNAGGDLFATFEGLPNTPSQTYAWSFPWGSEPGYLLVKWSPVGAHVFTKQMTAWTAFLQPGSSGEVFVGGLLGPGFDLGCGLLTGTSYAGRLDASGQCSWSRALGLDLSTGGDLTSLGPTADGSLLLVSRDFHGTANLGCGPMTSDPNGSSLVAKLDASGACVWSKSFPTRALRAALFPSGDVLLSAPFTGTLDLGGGSLTSVGAYDLAVARLDASGAHAWSKRFGAAGVSLCDAPPYCGHSGQAVADAGGNVVLSGPLTGVVDFGGGPLGSTVEQTYVVKLDGAGALRWQHQLPARSVVTPDPCGAVLCASDVGTSVTALKLAP